MVSVAVRESVTPPAVSRFECRGTNSRAERGLRPAVISRKISCGNKTEQGAITWAAAASLAATAAQKDGSFIDQVAQRSCSNLSP